MSEKYLSPTDYLLTNVNGQVLTITLNRPDALNSIRPEMLDGIRKLIVNTENSQSLEVLLREIQSWPGVLRTETQLILYYPPYLCLFFILSCSAFILS